MAESILRSQDDVMPYVAHVRRLADAHRAELGFLPKSAYSEAAAKDNLWVAVEKVSKEFQGYLLLGGPHPRMRVFQICTIPGHRTSGIGRTLLSELATYSTSRGYLSITAKVSSRLKANRFWRQAGFRIIKQVPGRSQGTTINVYSRDLSVPSLFSDQAPAYQTTIQVDQRRPLLHTPWYVIDLNVYFDALRNRDQGQCSQIISSAMKHEILVYVTPEFTKELVRASHDQKNDPVLEFAKHLPTLPQTSTDQLQTTISNIKKLRFYTSHKKRQWTENDESDLTHLAYSIRHRAFGFITRDRGVLRSAKILYEHYGLQVVSPTEVVETIVPESYPIRKPVMAISTDREIRVSNINDQNRAKVEQFLLRHDSDQRPVMSWQGTMSGIAWQEPIVVSSSDHIVGLGLWSGPWRSATDSVIHLFVDEGHPDADRAIDHILAVSPTIGDADRVWRFNLKIPRNQSRTIETALKRGFHLQRSTDSDNEYEFTRVAFRGAILPGHWPRIVRSLLERTGLHIPESMPTYQELTNTGIVVSREGARRSWPMSLFDFETFISPGLLVPSQRNAVIVPIQERYAADLLPETSVQGLLISQHDAAFRLERAYFLNAGRHSLVPRGRLVVFYVSEPRSAAVAIARVAFSDKVTTTQATLGLNRQGVLEEDDIRGRANSRGEISVFTFDNILRFSNDIGFKTLKEIGCVGGVNLVTLQRISSTALRCLVEEGFRTNVE